MINSTGLLMLTEFGFSLSKNCTRLTAIYSPRFLKMTNGFAYYVIELNEYEKNNNYRIVCSYPFSASPIKLRRV